MSTDTPERKAPKEASYSNSPETTSITPVSEPRKRVDEITRRYLRERFDIPDGFMDLAVKIWWDGKED